MSLTLSECIKFASAIDSAEASSDIGTLEDLLEQVAKGLGTKNVLKFMADSKLSKKINKLTSHSNKKVAGLSSEIVSSLRKLVAQSKNKPPGAAVPSAPAASSEPVKSEMKSEVKSEVKRHVKREVKRDVIRKVKREVNSEAKRSEERGKERGGDRQVKRDK